MLKHVEALNKHVESLEGSVRGDKAIFVMIECSRLISVAPIYSQKDLGLHVPHVHQKTLVHTSHLCSVMAATGVPRAHSRPIGGKRKALPVLGNRAS